jgi:hypothetical protein
LVFEGTATQSENDVMKKWKEFDEGFDPENPNPSPAYWIVAFFTIITVGVFAGLIAVII